MPGLTQATNVMRQAGYHCSSVHLRWLNPLHPKLGELMSRFKRVLVPEMNNGQLVRVLRAEYLVDAVAFNRVRGLPLSSDELHDAIDQLIGSKG